MGGREGGTEGGREGGREGGKERGRGRGRGGRDEGEKEKKAKFMHEKWLGLLSLKIITHSFQFATLSPSTIQHTITLASYPGLLAPAFVACKTW